MATAFIGNLLVSNVSITISRLTDVGILSGVNQVLSSDISAVPAGGSGNYSLQWSSTGQAITFTNPTSSSTNCTYVNGGNVNTLPTSTNIFCTVSDLWTGVQYVTQICSITWKGVPNIQVASIPNFKFSTKELFITISPASASGIGISWTGNGFNISNLTTAPQFGGTFNLFEIVVWTSSGTSQWLSISGTA